jgi:GT2 family glycosyltransferase
MDDRLTLGAFKLYWGRVALSNPHRSAFGRRAVIAQGFARRLANDSGVTRMRRRLLTLAVHLDAFRSDPFGYAQAMFWRAYALWIARVEPRVRAELLDPPSSTVPSILLVVDVVGTNAAIAETLQSINASAKTGVVQVGGPSVPGVSHVEEPAELAKWVGAEARWLCIVRAGDRLAPDALRIYANAAARSSCERIIYADDDLIDEGQRRAPHFKSCWNPELFDHHDFITGSAVIRTTAEMLAGLPSQGWLEELVRRAVRLGPAPMHLPAVLHHRAERPQPRLPARPSLLGAVEGPLVSVIVPTRDQLAYLLTCIEGVQRTSYSAIELIVVDNESKEPGTLAYLDRLGGAGAKVIKASGPFNFSALNNVAVEQARGTLLCFLNNDVEVIDPDWLSLLVRQAVHPDLGAVGGRLLYPDGTVQHAGVVTGVGGGAAHAHRLQRDGERGYFLRDRLPQRISAVTAACLVVSKEKFLAVGGFNERDFPVAFNDVDLCMKLNARGWQSFYEPRAVLIHHESKSRGDDRSKTNRDRFARELAALKRHWGTDRERDPYHHPQLSPFCEQFHIGI